MAKRDQRAPAAIDPATSAFCRGALAYMADQLRMGSLRFVDAVTQGGFEEVLRWFAEHPMSVEGFERVLKDRAERGARLEIRRACAALLSDWRQPSVRAVYVQLGEQQPEAPAWPAWQPPPDGAAGLGGV